MCPGADTRQDPTHRLQRVDSRNGQCVMQRLARLTSTVDTLTRNGKKQTWLTENAPIYALRQVVSIDGDRIVFDAPLVDSIDASLEVKGFVAKVEHPTTASEVGVVRLSFRSPR